jgi:hypothetical protein
VNDDSTAQPADSSDRTTARLARTNHVWPAQVLKDSLGGLARLQRGGIGRYGLLEPIRLWSEPWRTRELAQKQFAGRRDARWRNSASSPQPVTVLANIHSVDLANAVRTAIGQRSTVNRKYGALTPYRTGQA